MTFSGGSSIWGFGWQAYAGCLALLLGAAWWKAEAEQERLRQERQRRWQAAQARLRQEQAAAERERVGTAHAAAIAREARERQQRAGRPRAAAASQIHLKKLQLAADAERRIFHGSAFQQVYDRTPAKPHAELGKRERLVALGRKRDAKMFSQQTEAGKTIVQAVINLWTAHAGWNALLKDLNQVLIDATTTTMSWNAGCGSCGSRLTGSCGQAVRLNLLSPSGGAQN